MVSITLSVPQELKKIMDEHEDVNWSAVARQAIKDKITMLEKFRKFTEESTITERDALKIGKQITRSARKRHKK